ncbi:MAG: hypothetical protein Q4B26_06085 [Eubacteriales bacterium]|nr:hypothetical protein [Eubacteriales bacterium]
MNKTTFEVGDKLSFVMLYGGYVSGVVTARSENALVLTEHWVAEDTGSEVSSSTTYHIEKEDGKEYIELWEYRGHHCIIYAGGNV